MDIVEWTNPSSVEANDVMLPDNLLEFVKDDDIVNSLNAQDDILPQGQFPFIFVFLFLFLFLLLNMILCLFFRRHF